MFVSFRQDTSRPLTILVLFLAVLVSGRNASAEPGAPKWELVDRNLAVLRNVTVKSQTGAEIRFTAVRFHLGYHRLRLAGTLETLAAGRDVKDGIAKFTVNGEQKAELLSYSLEGVLNHLKERPLVLASAGWATNQRRPDQVGLLKIGGRTLFQATTKPTFSAILCLHDSQFYSGYDSMVPVVFTLSNSTKLNPRATKCPDAVQIGPRIIEEGAKPGISEGELRTERYKRVIFFVDDPHRNEWPPKSRDAARNGYILVTHNKVHLFDLQSYLLTKEIYDGGDPHWAVNLAGDDQSGLVINDGAEPELIENTLATVGSVIIVERKSK